MVATAEVVIKATKYCNLRCTYCYEYPELGIRGPQPGQSTSVTIHLHVDDADAVLKQAVDAGATLERAAEDHFYGERSGTVRDPFGHRWLIGHSIEKVEPDEMQRRYTESAQ